MYAPLPLSLPLPAEYLMSTSNSNNNNASFMDRTWNEHGSEESAFLLTIFYYRATLCVSAVFAVARCRSVCPSVCHVGGLYLDG